MFSLRGGVVGDWGTGEVATFASSMAPLGRDRE